MSNTASQSLTPRCAEKLIGSRLHLLPLQDYLNHSLASRLDYERFRQTLLPHTDVLSDQADETWVALRSDKPAAHISLWYERTPPLHEEKIGCIGHYAATDPDSGTAILRHAAGILAGRGCDLAVGPMDGSTWRRYRFVIDSNSLPAFLMEPRNPDAYPDHFRKNGFQTLATYKSSIMKVQAAFNKNDADTIDGISIRTIDTNAFLEELKLLYEISRLAFKGNFLYSDISEHEFIRMYSRCRELIQPELVFIAECEGLPVGYLFAMPDPILSSRSSKTLVIKTLARLPGAEFKGLGLKLVHACHSRALLLGFDQVIHALYKEDNISSSFSCGNDDFAPVDFRRYALFSKRLGGT